MIVMLKAQKAVLSLFQQKQRIAEEKIMDYLESFSDEQYQPITVDTPMKHSIYNVIKHKGRISLIYNTLFNSMITLSDSEFQQYDRLQFTDLTLVGALADNGLILPRCIDEFEHYAYYQNVLNDRMDIPPHCTIVLTSKCNARCIYCYEEGVLQSDMSMETAEKTAEVLCTSKSPVGITWFGGEPLLKTELIQRITEILRENHKEFDAGIITNGSLLTEEMIVHQFPEWNISWIQISIDGMEPEYLRRKCYCGNTDGLFETLMQNIGRLLSHNISVSIRLNMDNNNAENCIKAAQYLHERFQEHKNLLVYPAFLTGSEHGLSDECRRISCSGDIYRLYPPDQTILREIPKLNSCYYHQKGAFVIDTDGSVLCCERDVGRRKTRIASIQDVNSMDHLKKPVSLHPRIRERCRVCAYYPKCLGGCVPEAAASPNTNAACFMEKYKVEHLLNRMLDF